VAGSAKKVLFDKRSLALSAARLKAWWEGAPFDAAAFEAQFEPAPPVAANDAAEDLFEPERDQRLAALQLVWGEGRLAPGDDTIDELAPARLAAPDGGALAVFGPGLARPVISLAPGWAGAIAVYEWRKETRAALTAGLKAAGLAERVAVHPFDLETGHIGDETLDGLISTDDFTYCENPSRLAVQFARALKPGCGGLIEAYAAAPGPDVAPGFASAFAEPQLHTAAKIGELLFEAGFRIEEDEDLTALHAEWARAGIQRLKASLAAPSLSARGLQELAWEMETWRARLRLLDAGRMQRRAWRVTRR
jgi:hypothetical protein